MIRVIDGTPVVLDKNRADWDPDKNSKFIRSITLRKENVALVSFGIKCIAVVFSLATLVLLTNSHIAGFIFLVITYTQFFPQFMCFLHEYSHWKPLTYFALVESFLIDVVLSIFMGMPPMTYYIQHAQMHHHGENIPGIDLSSTEDIQRDNVFHILMYWLRRFSPPGVVFDLICYCFQRQRLWVNGFFYIIGVLVVLFAPLPSTTYLWLVLAPLCLTSLAAGIGGVSQHMFLNPDNPRKVYSFEVINSKANYDGFNEGFHHTHHLKFPHWTDCPKVFLENFDDYMNDGVLVFEKFDNPEILYLVVTGQYERLAKHMVGNRKMEMEEAVGIIKAYLRPIERNETK